ncbi:hypothetical protein ACEN9J_38760 [Variovorax sp. Varisp41]|uniref:hypothetical protein n=1 Tax=Variovorax sp. Varisp41 TaxID=3243033 RepID=UPI0039B3FF06
MPSQTTRCSRSDAIASGAISSTSRRMRSVCSPIVGGAVGCGAVVPVQRIGDGCR